MNLRETGNVRFFAPSDVPFKDTAGPEEPFLGAQAVKDAWGFHRSLPGYTPTPLLRLRELSRRLALGDILVKDESFRFGLNGFKGLGGSYAIARVIAEKAGLDPASLTYEVLRSEPVKRETRGLVFATATAGNHGKGVAWASGLLGYPSVVYVPRNTAAGRVRAIEDLGAKVVITKYDYDDTVRSCTEDAASRGYVLVQDTAWEGYTEIPKWIMQGYTTMVSEINEQIGEVRPTHMFLQAGVGGMAAAVLGAYANLSGGRHPLTVVVEPEEAPCLFATAKGGKIPRFGLDTMMAGLACGEPNPVAYEVLRGYCRGYVSCDDTVAAKGMRILARPFGNDPAIVSGESGAVTLGLLATLIRNDDYRNIREALRLDETSKVLLISTEGDTDPVNYRAIVG